MVVTDLTGPRRTLAEEMQHADATRQVLLERVLAAQEDERRRIARELHDEAGQLLTSLLVGLRGLEDARNVADAKAMGRRLREITARAIDEVGRLARGLHPTVLDDHGLGVALSRYVAEYTKTHRIAVETMDKVREYLHFGVAWVWVIDPVSLTGQVHSRSGVVSVEDRLFSTDRFSIDLSKDEL